MTGVVRNTFALLLARKVDQEGNMDQRLMQKWAVVAINVLGERFAVIGGDNDDGVIKSSQRLELV